MRNNLNQPSNQTIDSHRHCIMCGWDNPLSFGLKFSKDKNGGVSTIFTGNSRLQGYEGLMHGGVLSALLDTAMAQCLIHNGIEAVTGELNVRYLAPVQCNSPLAIKAWVEASLPPLYHLKSSITIDGVLVCKGKARFMRRE